MGLVSISKAKCCSLKDKVERFLAKMMDMKEVKVQMTICGDKLLYPPWSPIFRTVTWGRFKQLLLWVSVCCSQTKF